MNTLQKIEKAQALLKQVRNEIADKGTSPSGSSSGALLSEPLAASQGDPLTYGSELALSDQAEAVSAWLSAEAAKHTDAYEREMANNEKYRAAQHQGAASALRARAAEAARCECFTAAAQSAAPKVETCARCAPDGVYYENPGFSPIACDHQPHGETAEASGSDNGPCPATEQGEVGCD